MRAHENPYRIGRVEALAFRGERTLPSVVADLRSLGFRGAIIGQEGSGKSTLLREIADELMREGTPSQLVRFDDRAWLMSALLDRNSVWLIDGAERIPLPLRAAVVGCVRRIVITAHGRTAGLPVLIRCKTTAALLRQLAADLGQPLPAEEVEARFRDAGGNLRLAFRSLYDDASGSGLRRGLAREVKNVGVDTLRHLDHVHHEAGALEHRHSLGA